MSRLTCSDCERTYSGSDRSGGHCMSCHQSFSAQGGFDKHRVGQYGIDRRCLTTDEMTAKGWHLDGRGDWRMPSKGNPWAIAAMTPTDGLPVPPTG